MHQHPVVEVVADGAGEDEALEVAADADQVLERVAVADPLYVLLDDRAGVELLGRVVGGGADQLHAAVVRAPVRIGAGEGREEGVVDVDHRAGNLLEELTAEDLHVAGKNDQVHAAGDQL